MKEWHEFDRKSTNSLDIFVSWLSRRSALNLCLCVSNKVLKGKAAISNGLFSLLSLPAVQRLNSDTAEKALDDSK